jgi:transketolase
MRIAEAREAAHQIRAMCTAVFLARGEGHLASSLSVAEVIAACYWGFLRIDPSRPQAEDRDRFVLSKAHASLAYYCALSLRGFFPSSWLWDYGSSGGKLPLEPLPSATPGVDIPTGPLGTGLAKAVGVAIGLRRRSSAARVVVVLGDGEAQKGQVWEAVAYAAHLGLGNMTAIVDRNGRQLDGPTDSVTSVRPAAMFAACGWKVMACNGHSPAGLIRRLHHPDSLGRPRVIIARTVKGKGIPSLERNPDHHYYRATLDNIEVPSHLARAVRAFQAAQAGAIDGGP